MTAERKNRMTRLGGGMLAAGLVAAGVLTVGLNGSPANAARVVASPSASGKLHNMLPAAVKKSGVIQDIINLPYPPMEFKQANSSKTTGFDIDMATAVAKELGVKIQFQNVLFPQIFPSVKTHRGDFAWTAVFDLKAREKNFNFIDYFKTGNQLFTSKANASKFKTLKSLCGHTVVVPTGTNFGSVVKQISKQHCGSASSISQISVQSPTDQELQIREGRGDAAISGPETILYLMKQQPGKWALVGPIVDPEYYSVVFAKNNRQMQNAVFAAMKATFADGKYKRILKKWGLSRAGIRKPLVNHGLS